MPCICPRCPFWECYPEIKYVGDRPVTPPIAPAAKSSRIIERPRTARSRKDMRQEAYMILIAAKELRCENNKKKE